MSKYDKRRWEVLIDGKTFIAPTDGKQFKMTFEVRVDWGGYTTHADIVFYNLSVDTKSKAFKRGSTITIKAGYADGIGVIFDGQIVNNNDERQGASTLTRLICRGGKVIEKQKSINETFGVDSKVTEYIRACVAAMGHNTALIESQFDDVDPYVRGYALSGDPRVALDTLASAHGFHYTIEGNTIVVNRDGFNRGTGVITISQFTGMEGIPEVTETVLGLGLDVTVRLNPKIKMFGTFEVKSELKTFNFSNVYFNYIDEDAGKGEFVIRALTHSGDTYGDTWSTKIIGWR
jgi:hypothetical protein